MTWFWIIVIAIAILSPLAYDSDPGGESPNWIALVGILALVVLLLSSCGGCL